MKTPLKLFGTKKALKIAPPLAKKAGRGELKKPKPVKKSVSLKKSFIFNPFLFSTESHIHNNNYNLNYTITRKTLFVDYLERSKNSSGMNLLQIYNDLFKIAQQKKVNKIIARTWIFVGRDKLAKELGFELVKGTDKHINNFLKEHPTYKIMGLKHGRFIFYDTKLKQEVFVHLYSKFFPTYIKNM